MGKAKKLRGPRGSERKPTRAEPFVLILVPTRELVLNRVVRNIHDRSPLFIHLRVSGTGL